MREIYYTIEVPKEFGQIGYNDWPLATGNKALIYWGDEGLKFLSELNGGEYVKPNQRFAKTLQAAQNKLEKYYRQHLRQKRK